MVGIGEHSNLMEEFDKWIEKLATAKGKLSEIQSFGETTTLTMV